MFELANKFLKWEYCEVLGRLHSSDSWLPVSEYKLQRSPDTTIWNSFPVLQIIRFKAPDCMYYSRRASELCGYQRETHIRDFQGQLELMTSNAGIYRQWYTRSHPPCHFGSPDHSDQEARFRDPQYSWKQASNLNCRVYDRPK